ncbi:MAG: DUF3857 domain-containing protein [Bacteroidales bacterium]|nr:DUF3857 domain-containing protein [Bacteroidales bacterium]
MIHKLVFRTALIAFICFSLNAVAQPKMKLGKVSKEELQMTVYEKDSTAEAFILGEKYYLNTKYSAATNSFDLQLEVHRRIKILHNDAIDEWGNISFNLYENKGKREKLVAFKGYTLNLVNGKIEEEKLALKDAFDERSSENYNTRKFTFKNVQVGSIIDYSYTIYSDFYTRIPDLVFQKSIPVMWSEMTFEYPEYFKYKYFMTGSERVYHSEKETLIEYSGGYEIPKISNTWVLKDIPSLKQLSFMRPVSNYRTKINYELYGVDFPGRIYENYSSSWEEINRDLMNSDNFGKLLDRLSPTQKIAEELGVSEASNMEKILAAVDYVQSNYIWNDKMRVYPSDEWRKNIKEKKGSTADLNFTLIGILKNLGINAHPVILSTRANGIIFESFPASEDFNYIITAIEQDGKFILVDPTSEFTGLNILPERCLNGKGMLISESGYKWIPIETGVPYSIDEFVQFSIDDELKVKANYQAKYSDYAAYFLRNSINKKGGEEKYIKESIEGNKELNISDFHLQNLKNLANPVIKRYTASPEDYLQEMGDIILFKPILFPNFTENPFKKDKRDFPVDFTFARNYSQTVIINLPEGYAFEEIPKNIRLAAHDRSLMLNVVYNIEGNKLSMIMKYNINKSFFKTDRYNEIKSFFDNVVAKENEQIIIRKI